MAIIAVPAKFQFSKVTSFKLQRAGNILRSKYTGQAQRIVYPYAVWELQANLVEYDGLDAGRIRSFLVQLEGQKHSFRLPVPGFTKPMTGHIGNGVSTLAAAARASSISIGATAGLTNAAFVAEGDYITINDELKIVTQAVSLVGANCTINFKPPLRKAAPIGTSVIVQNPTCLMTAQDDDVAGWAVSAPVRQGTSFDAIEAVEI